MDKVNCAIIGSGNIGTDLMYKIINTSSLLNLTGVIGIDPDSDGLAKAKSLGIQVSSKGIEGFTSMQEYQDTDISSMLHQHQPISIITKLLQLTISK